MFLTTNKKTLIVLGGQFNDHVTHIQIFVFANSISYFTLQILTVGLQLMIIYQLNNNNSDQTDPLDRYQADVDLLSGLGIAMM